MHKRLLIYFPHELNTNLMKAALSVVFFLPAFISPFMPNMLSRFVFFIDLVFSYLYALSPRALT